MDVWLASAKQAYFAALSMIFLSFCANNVIPPAWTLILPENWDESKIVFKGDVDGFKIEGRKGEGRKAPLRPSPLSLFLSFSRWRPRSMYLRVSVKKRLLCRL